jgi:hypothetical protein
MISYAGPNLNSSKDKQEDQCLPSYTADQLFLEMCRSSKKAIVHKGSQKEEQINWYYAEAAAYARRISGGDFSGKNAKHKPVFRLDLNTFSNELKALVERTKTSKEAIDKVIEDGVFTLLRARHERIFHQYIEKGPLRWEFISNGGE